MPKKERTEAQQLSYYKRALREAWNKSPMKWRAYRRALTRPGWLICEGCKKETYYKLVEIDHQVPCGSIVTEADVEQVAFRMNCPSSKLNVLCEACHKTKTKGDLKAIREAK